MTSFLSTASRYQVDLQHLAGSANIPSDFASKNAAECNNPSCQIYNFIIQVEDSVVRGVKPQANNTSSIDDMLILPFTTRSAWINIQADCPDLRRTHAHLKQGTRPSKKLTNIRDVKRYLNVATIAKDGLLVARRSDPLQPPAELIIVPRSVLDGLVTALHIRLDHPTKHQMMLVIRRNFFALDLSQAIDRVCDSCQTCVSLKKFPMTYTEQSSDLPPDVIGINFAADVIKQNRQLIPVVRETVTAYTAARLIDGEKAQTLREALLLLCMDLHPLDGPRAVIRVDPSPGFLALREDALLDRYRINLEIGRVKNVNKNPVAEKDIAELEEEILRQEPGGGPVSQLSLSTTVARLVSEMVDYQHEKCTHKGTSSLMSSSPCVTRTLSFKNKPSEIRTTSVVHSRRPTRKDHVPFMYRLLEILSICIQKMTSGYISKSLPVNNSDRTRTRSRPTNVSAFQQTYRPYHPNTSNISFMKMMIRKKMRQPNLVCPSPISLTTHTATPTTPDPHLFQKYSLLRRVP